MTVAYADFTFVRDLVARESAIVLDDSKDYLVESRLLPVARRAGLDGVGELVARLRAGAVNGFAREVVEALTTNETSWFRDAHPFTALSDVVVPGW